MSFDKQVYHVHLFIGEPPISFFRQAEEIVLFLAITLYSLDASVVYSIPL